jgi:tetratricopeptide repeat protein 30
MISDEVHDFNSTIYGHIKDKEYSAAAKILEKQPPRSRAALSLLAFCYYHNHEFINAADTYGRLIRLCPSVDVYRLYHIQALLKAGALTEAQHHISKIRNEMSSHHLLMIHLAVKMEDDDLNGCKAILNSSIQDDPETISAQAAINYKEGRYEEALSNYTDAFNMQGFEPSIAYNIALCHYMLQQHSEASDIIAEVIDRGTEQLADLDRQNHGDQCFIENSSQLQESYLIEAYNLKAAIEYDTMKYSSAKETIKSMPQRREEELDPVTLHNNALINMVDNADDSFSIFSFLLSNPPFPPVTFRNLLTLYCKHGCNDIAADILAENANLTFDLLTQDIYDYFDASIMITASPEEALKKFEALSKKGASNIRSLKKDVSRMERSGKEEETQEIKNEIANQMKLYLPILMSQASVHWERGDYVMVEQVLRQSEDICNDEDEWNLNLAHALFTQQGPKFKECIEYYEPFVNTNGAESLLRISPIVLANLCVAYIMTNQNEEAEEIMKRVEKEETLLKTDDDPAVAMALKVKHHGCIINLVIGTLYCEKENYEFGISRICKSLKPYGDKLGPDTWHYAKRCLIALIDRAAKYMILVNKDMTKIVLTFFDEIIDHGKDIASTFDRDGSVANADASGQQTSNTIASEAMKLRSIFYEITKL